MLFCLSSGLLAFFFGAAIASVIRGVPLNAGGSFFEPLWTDFDPRSPTPGILDWYTLLIGLLGLAALILHGASYLAARGLDCLHDRARRVATRAWLATVILTVLGTVATFAVRPHLLQSFAARPWAVVFPILAIAGLLGVRVLHARGHDGRARAVLMGARETVGQRAAIGVKSRLRHQVMSALVELGPSVVRRERAGELVALLGTGLERLDARVSRYLPQRVLAITGPLVVAAYVCWLDPLSAALLVGSAPVVPLLMVAVGSYTEERTRAQWTALGNVSAHLFDLIQGLPTLKLLGRERDEAARVARSGEDFRIRTMQGAAAGIPLRARARAAEHSRRRRGGRRARPAAIERRDWLRRRAPGAVACARVLPTAAGAGRAAARRARRSSGGRAHGRLAAAPPGGRGAWPASPGTGRGVGCRCLG